MRLKGISASVLLLVLAPSSCVAFQTSNINSIHNINNMSPSLSTQHNHHHHHHHLHLHHHATAMRSASNGNDEPNQEETKNRPKNGMMRLSRRSAITNSAAVATSILFSNNSNNNSNQNANAFDINPFKPLDRKITNNYEYSPSKRATAYLVDSTIPPTLVPFKAQREAAILKGLGSGLGTQKTPFIEDKLTLNNMMNKGVFGTIDFVKTATGSGLDNEEEIDLANKNKNGYDASFIFLGIDYKNNNDVTPVDGNGDDVQLAIELLNDILKPRRGLDTALALSFVPIPFQRQLNEYMSSTKSDVEAESILVNTLTNDGQIQPYVIQNQLPLLRYAKAKQLKLIASSPTKEDIMTVRTQGLQNIDPERRSNYVVDAQGFIDWTQESKNKLYTERSLLKDWVPVSDDETSPNGYFAEKILCHEAIATRMANYVFIPNENGSKKKKSLVVNVGPIADVRFLGGPNGRIARICKVIQPDAIIDEEAVTTILINPSAKETLSQSKFIRLEIGTAPKTIQYQTKVADYLWFSSMPKVNMIPRLMNG